MSPLYKFHFYRSIPFISISVLSVVLSSAFSFFLRCYPTDMKFAL